MKTVEQEVEEGIGAATKTLEALRAQAVLLSLEAGPNDPGTDIQMHLCEGLRDVAATLTALANKLG